jgi:CHAT domain-containing protein
LGRYLPAIDNLSSALKLAGELGQEQQIVDAASNLGVTYWEMGDYDRAATLLQQAIADARKFALKRNQGADSNNLGLVYKNAGKLREAREKVEQAYQIALEIQNRRDQAIALSNLALLARMEGQNREAEEKYKQALAIYEEIGFQEGKASALMGLAKIDSLGKNYTAALEKLNAAAAIYEKLENPGFLAEAYNQIGQVYQKMSAPNRRSRDLVFEDDEPTVAPAQISPDQALERSREFFTKSLKLAQTSGRREFIWGALHGLAFAHYRENKLEEAEKLYAQAIDVLLSMRGAVENPDLLQAFLYDKDDLFSEAIEVCSKLYARAKDPEMLRKQMMYDEILRNEVLRANMRMSGLSYAEPAKQAIYNDIIRLSAARQKAQTALRSAQGRVAARPEEAKNDSLQAELLSSEKDAGNLEKEFETRLRQWRERYPQDAVLFDSMANVDTRQLRERLNEQQAIVQYLPLSDSLIIIVMTTEKMDMFNVPVTYQELASLIRDQLLADNIENFGHITDYLKSKVKSKEIPAITDEAYFEQEAIFYDEVITILGELYTYLYAPVAESLRDKSHLYFLTSKYLSYVPFAALVSGENEDGTPQFLVQEKTITLTRLSFIQQSGTTKPASLDVISVGDPVHNELKGGLVPLPGARQEAQIAVEKIQAINAKAKQVLLIGEEATKSAWYESVQSHPYSIMYFATHGVPFAEMKFTATKMRNSKDADRRAFVKFYDENFQNPSHLNGFLYMSYPDGQENGVLFLKDILALPDQVFAQAYLAILSACNTGVSYSPKVLRDTKQNVEEELEGQAEAQLQVAEAGWTPGVDQVCLVDTFMRRNFKNVYGTLWFASDAASAFIMGKFLDYLKNMSPADALRQAQLDYLEEPPETGYSYTRHPFLWACGNIFGQ